MGLGLSIAKQWRTAARMLALVAAITVAIGVHPPHAAAVDSSTHPHSDHDQGSGHGHSGISCLQVDLDEAQSTNLGGFPLSHTDCTQAFDPLLRPPVTAIPVSVLASVAVPSDLSFRQYVTSFDPPPPRRV